MQSSKRPTKVQQAWQPMDTAPRDGTVVDLFHKNGFRITDQWWIDEDDCWVCLFGDSEFIAWMPVPGYPEFQE